MIKQKNKVMIVISVLSVLLSVIIHILGRVYHLFDYTMLADSAVSSIYLEENYGGILYALLFLPIFLAGISLFLYKLKKEHTLLPFMNTLCLTFASISMIAGGSGRIEFHFSIFMVVAALAFYGSISLISIMTTIFAVQHLLGFFVLPEIVFGYTDYSLRMLIIHALFLVLTSGATSWQVFSNKNIQKQLEVDKKQERKSVIDDIVGRMSATSASVLETAKHLNQKAELTDDNSRRMASSISELTEGAQRQWNRLNENVHVMNEMSDGMEQMAGTSVEVSNKSEETAATAEAGEKTMESFMDAFEHMRGSVEASYYSFRELEEKIRSIDQMLEVIRDIAARTNLLSLNASIEATAAGEKGKGFAVVAEEVRKLAAQSEASVYRISEQIKTITHGTNDTVDSMDKVKEDVEAGLHTLQDVRTSFSTILQTTKEVDSQLKEHSSSVRQLVAGTEQAAASMEEVRDIAGRTQDETFAMGASSNQQLDHIEKISDSADLLHQFAADLDEVIQKIKEDEE
ncbi:methyl-accepting chemotaxis protein [Salibacterium aidingense]|uniref:methyl-accepting chemotaxis protein n=1 Tax=Salibacterium aidingense TaxID=384933 RepID=UPI003BCA4446